MLNDFLKLEPYAFDQTDEGWRQLDAKGKYIDAARLIEAYIHKNEESIKSQDRVSLATLYFHAGQEYAMAGEQHYSFAIMNMKKSYKSIPDWDTYVDGTIAFLSRDTSTLNDAANKLSMLAEQDTRLTANAELLHGLLNALSSNVSYASVYGD